MTRSIAKAKPTLKHLMVLKRMVDENLGFSMSSGYGISTSMTFFSTSTYEFIDGSTYWFDNNIAPLNMYRWLVPKNISPVITHSRKPLISIWDFWGL